MKDSDRPWASPLLLVLCLTVPAVLVTWAISRPHTYTLPTHLTAPAQSVVVGDSDLHRRVELVEAKETILRETIAQQQQLATLGLGLVALLMTTVGLLLPVITYLTSILPGQKVVEEARELIGGGLDRRFEQLLAKQQAERTAAAIAQVRSDDINEQATGAQHLALSTDLALTDHQILELIEVLKRVGGPVLSQIANALAPRASSYITNAFAELISSANAPLLLPPVIRHCGLPGTEALRARVKAWSSSPDGWAQASTVLMFALTSAPAFFEHLVNDQVWVRGIPVRTRGIIIASLKGIIKAYGQDAFADSCLAKSVEGTHYTSLNSTFQDCTVEDAAHVVVLEDGLQKGFFSKGAKGFDEALAKVAVRGADAS